MPNIFVGGNRVQLNPQKAIGKGGEAEIYDLNGKALKVYKTPDHVDYSGDPHAQKAAVERLELQQRKLPAFPKGVHPQVVSPEELAYDDKKMVAGYTMLFLSSAEVLLKYGERSFCQGSVSSEDRLTILKNLHPIVAAAHKAGIVIGDFNDLNVLIKGLVPYLVDADSFQFKSGSELFYCATFTNNFVDPLICDPNAAGMMMAKPHSPMTDWYAYCIMLMQSLLFVGPYGGVYKPANPNNRVNHDTRPLKRITVFNSEVKYPKPAVPFCVLPDDLLQILSRTFEKDERSEFPYSLLENMRYTTCTNCSMEHARNVCPQCAAAVPGVVKQVVQVRGKVVATRIFKTDGNIVFATHQNGELKWLYNDSKGFQREDPMYGVVPGTPTVGTRYRIHRKTNIFGSDNKMVAMTIGFQPVVKLVDTFGRLPLFDANEFHIYWIENGQLRCSADVGDPYAASRVIGDVLQNQTLFWVGSDMGFGFYRAGSMSVAFVFNSLKGGLNDTVKLPSIKGQLIDSTCAIHGSRAWFFTSVQENGKTINQCHLIRLDGTVEGSAVAEKGDGSWLSNIRGTCALGNFLLVPTDDGIVRVEPVNGKLQVVKEFPDTEPWVNTASNLFPGPSGVYTVDRKEIHLLKIS